MQPLSSLQTVLNCEVFFNNITYNNAGHQKHKYTYITYSHPTPEAGDHLQCMLQ